jgi:hypothetical protein
MVQILNIEGGLLNLLNSRIGLANIKTKGNLIVKGVVLW